MPNVAAGYVRLNYSSTYSDIKILSCKGIDEPEWVEYYPAIVNTYLDGSKASQFTSMRRRIRIDCGVIRDRALRMAILNWSLDNDRTIDYTVDNGDTIETFSGIAVNPMDPDGYESSWAEGLSFAKKFVLEVDESIVRTSFPAADVTQYIKSLMGTMALTGVLTAVKNP